jgi:hypothetical protein
MTRFAGLFVRKWFAPYFRMGFHDQRLYRRGFDYPSNSLYGVFSSLYGDFAVYI